jgi:hypothetical protein
LTAEELTNERKMEGVEERDEGNEDMMDGCGHGREGYTHLRMKSNGKEVPIPSHFGLFVLHRKMFCAFHRVFPRFRNFFFYELLIAFVSTISC